MPERGLDVVIIRRPAEPCCPQEQRVHVLALAAERAVNHRITSVYSHWDPHIPAGSGLEGAEEVVLDTPGHFRPLADERLHALLLERLISPGAAAAPA